MPGIPKNEIKWVSYYDSNGVLTHVLTSRPVRDYYMMYEVQGDGTVKKLGRAKTPTELEKLYICK